MASPSSSAAPPTPLTPRTQTPCIRAFYLNAASSAAVLEVARAVKYDQEASGQHLILAVKTLAEARIWSPIAISSSSWEKVSALRTQLISESDSVRNLPVFYSAPGSTKPSFVSFFNQTLSLTRRNS
jgi:hypothetical protein